VHDTSAAAGDKSTPNVPLTSTPPPPFSNAVSGAICATSALAPYPLSLLEGLPLRGVMEYLKLLHASLRRAGGGNGGARAEVMSALANVAHVYFNMHRLLMKLFPAALVGFDLDLGEDLGDGGHLHPQQHHADVRSDGSMRLIGMQTPEKTTVAKREGGAGGNRHVPAPSVEQLRWLGRELDATKLSSALQALRARLLTQHENVPGVEAQTPSLSSLADAFLWHVLRPLCAQSSPASMPASHLRQVSDVWSLLHASPLSSSVLLHRTLLLLVDQSPTVAADEWESLEVAWSWETMLLDPFAVVLSVRKRVWSSAPLLRVCLAALFALQVASSSFIGALAKADYVSALVLRQARHHAAYSSYTTALKLMGPGAGATERMRGHTSKEVDPMQLHLTHHIERAYTALLPPPPASAPAHPADSSSKKESDSTAEANGRDAKRLKTEHAADVSAAPPATASQGAKSEPSSPIKREEGVQHDCAPSSVASAALPLPFLVSERMLTLGEQMVFSSDFALAPPPGAPEHEPSAAERAASTPTLRAFAFVLGNRAAVAQELLEHAAAALRECSTRGVAAAGDTAECIDVLLGYVALLFSASTPAGSAAPSSLLLLLLVQGVAPEVLPLLFTRFSAQLGGALEREGALLERVEAGVGAASSAAEQSARAQFMRLLLLLRDALERIEEQAQYSAPADVKPGEVALRLRQLSAAKPQLAAVLSSWAAAIQLFPASAPLLSLACELPAAAAL